MTKNTASVSIIRVWKACQGKYHAYQSDQKFEKNPPIFENVAKTVAK